ncbi:WxcM-like domain-containing protein [Fulvivirga sp. RKSG066]|uniref:sugar 3,4-ketoisomerase n=1 Tax=Fulvivirga aurantia TaxID=2529383 RepID=UPI0012BD3347|nr:FdtA/QdtA family cupin domain-containing protein [Fulvivirga aurantia]MTI22052.1 WxcM-like domain-containing protein [Fulvivirga aurantia]
MTESLSKPHFIPLNKITDRGGDLSVIEDDLPFAIKRVFWIYNIEEEITRGSHAHQDSEKCLICMHKSVKVKLTNTEGEEFTFVLDNPSKVLYFPKMHWIDLTYEKGAILTVLASTTYAEEQFIHDIDTFKRTK